jgi:hypothetical protein
VVSGLKWVYRRAAWLGSALERWSTAVFLSPRFGKIGVEFFKEAAVLVAVFPILDRIIEKGGMAKVTWSLVAWSEGIAAMLLFFAGILAEMAERTGR